MVRESEVPLGTAESVLLPGAAVVPQGTQCLDYPIFPALKRWAIFSEHRRQIRPYIPCDKSKVSPGSKGMWRAFFDIAKRKIDRQKPDEYQANTCRRQEKRASETLRFLTSTFQYYIGMSGPTTDYTNVTWWCLEKEERDNTGTGHPQMIGLVEPICRDSTTDLPRLLRRDDCVSRRNNQCPRKVRAELP